MIGGFALVAVPAEYRVTGVKTFLVSADGIVYQKDLGPDSLEIVKKMELYNPDKTWQPTDDAVAARCCRRSVKLIGLVIGVVVSRDDTPINSTA